MPVIKLEFEGIEVRHSAVTSVYPVPPALVCTNWNHSHTTTYSNSYIHVFEIITTTTPTIPYYTINPSYCWMPDLENQAEKSFHTGGGGGGGGGGA